MRDSGGPRKCQLAILPKHFISLFRRLWYGSREVGDTDSLVLPNIVYWNQMYLRKTHWCGVFFFFPPLELPSIKCGCHLKRASFPMNSESVTQSIDWSVLPTARPGPEWSCPCDPIFRAHRHLHSLANSISKWQNGGGQRCGCVYRNNLAERWQEWMILYHGQLV